MVNNLLTCVAETDGYGAGIASSDVAALGSNVFFSASEKIRSASRLLLHKGDLAGFVHHVAGYPPVQQVAVMLALIPVVAERLDNDAMKQAFLERISLLPDEIADGGGDAAAYTTQLFAEMSGALIENTLTSNTPSALERVEEALGRPVVLNTTGGLSLSNHYSPALAAVAIAEALPDDEDGETEAMRQSTVTLLAALFIYQSRHYLSPRIFRLLSALHTCLPDDEVTDAMQHVAELVGDNPRRLGCLSCATDTVLALVSCNRVPPITLARSRSGTDEKLHADDGAIGEPPLADLLQKLSRGCATGHSMDSIVRALTPAGKAVFAVLPGLLMQFPHYVDNVPACLRAHLNQHVMMPLMVWHLPDKHSRFVRAALEAITGTSAWGDFYKAIVHDDHDAVAAWGGRSNLSRKSEVMQWWTASDAGAVLMADTFAKYHQDEIRWGFMTQNSLIVTGDDKIGTAAFWDVMLEQYRRHCLPRAEHDYTMRCELAADWLKQVPYDITQAFKNLTAQSDGQVTTPARRSKGRRDQSAKTDAATLTQALEAQGIASDYARPVADAIAARRGVGNAHRKALTNALVNFALDGDDAVRNSVMGLLAFLRDRRRGGNKQQAAEAWLNSLPASQLRNIRAAYSSANNARMVMQDVLSALDAKTGEHKKSAYLRLADWLGDLNRDEEGLAEKVMASMSHPSNDFSLEFLRILVALRGGQTAKSPLERFEVTDGMDEEEIHAMLDTIHQFAATLPLSWRRKVIAKTISLFFHSASPAAVKVAPALATLGEYDLPADWAEHRPPYFGTDIDTIRYWVRTPVYTHSAILHLRGEDKSLD